MIRGCKKLFTWKAIHDFVAFLNAESVDCFVSSISYTISEVIKKN